MDCCGERTSSLKVRVGLVKIDNQASSIEQSIQLSNTPECGNWPQKGNTGEPIEIICHTPQQGSVVIIQISNPNPQVNYMNIAEIKIYGTGIKRSS